MATKADDAGYSHYWNEKYACPTLHKYADGHGTIIGPYYYAFSNRPGEPDQRADEQNIKISTRVSNPSAKAMIFDALQAPDCNGVFATKHTSRTSYLLY